jgi:hypothetical protein
MLGYLMLVARCWIWNLEFGISILDARMLDARMLGCSMLDFDTGDRRPH